MTWFKPNTTIDEKIEIYRNYGLNDNEIQNLLTPLSNHNPEMRKIAYMANDKLSQAIDKENEEYDKLHPKRNLSMMERLKYEANEEDKETLEATEQDGEVLTESAIPSTESP